MTESAIELRGVSKTFGRTRAVRDLELVIPRGSLCGFLGPNGAGKSTTIRMIMSIIYPDTGEIRVLGGNALANKDRIGYLPEERGVYRKMRVGEFLRYMGKLKGVDSNVIQRRIDDWLDRVDLPDVQKKRCEELSKGMQQKVQFLAAIIHEPELLILDEPFSGLDPVNAQILNQIIRDLHAAGTTIIFSTHVLHQAEQICDRILLIHHGEKLLDDTLGDIRHRFDPRTIEVEALTDDISFNGIADIERVIPHEPQVGTNENAHYELVLTEHGDPQHVMQTVMASGPMRSVRLRRPTLEDVFVELVMKDAGEEAAAEAREELSHV